MCVCHVLVCRSGWACNSVMPSQDPHKNYHMLSINHKMKMMMTMTLHLSDANSREVVFLSFIKERQFLLLATLGVRFVCSFMKACPLIINILFLLENYLYGYFWKRWEGGCFHGWFYLPLGLPSVGDVAYGLLAKLLTVFTGHNWTSYGRWCGGKYLIDIFCCFGDIFRREIREWGKI